MDYAEAREAFFQPHAADSTPQELSWSSPARALRDAIEPLATICFWSEPAYDEYAAVGLDFLEGYVWGRASALGEPEATVAAAAFGVFEPGLIATLYDQGRAHAPLADVRRAKQRGAERALREVLGEPDELGDLVDLLGHAALAGDPVGRPFYAGLRALEWPADDLGRLWHACTLLREHRGDGHLAALVGAGVDGISANILTERWVGWDPLAYTASRAWPEEAMAAATDELTERGLIDATGLTDRGRGLREDVERTTDRAAAAPLAALGDQAEQVTATLAGWADQVVAAGWFPPDPFKRASG